MERHRQSEYLVLRQTIAHRGTLRPVLVLGGIAVWAALLIAVLVLLPYPGRRIDSAARTPRNLRSYKAFTLRRGANWPLRAGLLRGGRGREPPVERHPVVGARGHELRHGAWRRWACAVRPSLLARRPRSTLSPSLLPGPVAIELSVMADSAPRLHRVAGRFRSRDAHAACDRTGAAPRAAATRPTVTAPSSVLLALDSAPPHRRHIDRR